jgi:hypothetical protein
MIRKRRVDDQKGEYDQIVAMELWKEMSDVQKMEVYWILGCERARKKGVI